MADAADRTMGTSDGPVPRFRPRNPRRLRGRRPAPLTVAQILAWVDSHYARTKSWPHATSGYVFENRNETWRRIDGALKAGFRGLEGGVTLAGLLCRERNVRKPSLLPPLSEEQIGVWAEKHFQRTGSWPDTRAGVVQGSGGETWHNINVALHKGFRGFEGADSLARLLARRFGVRSARAQPHLTVDEILGWADAHFRRTGRWPWRTCGPVAEAPGETWVRIHSALAAGLRGLPGGTTLAQLLSKYRGVDSACHPRLTVTQILTWADAHYHHTGRWPGVLSGAIVQAPAETWAVVDKALREGGRGLPGGSSLPRLLTAHRGARNKVRPPPLKVADILRWADAHRRRTGHWPKRGDGPVVDAPGESWSVVDWALLHGQRGLRGGSSLIRLLAKYRKAHHRLQLSPLSVARVLHWADRHRKRTGAWPKATDGPVFGAKCLTWKAVDWALRLGRRGLPGGTSLVRLLEKHRGLHVRAKPAKQATSKLESAAHAAAGSP